MLILLSTPIISRAAPLDEVTLQPQGALMIATVKLTTPVHFLRFAPIKDSRMIEIYYERIPSSDSSDPWQDHEIRHLPETMLTPAFTVSTRDQARRPKLVVEFASAVNFKVNVGADSRSFVISITPRQSIVSLNTKFPKLPTVLPPMSNTSENELNQQAYVLMQAGRDALALNHYAAATTAFNQLLALRVNAYSQDAQEWVGVTRERSGQPAKARAEYALYLKQFPNSQSVPRVKQRLAQLTLTAETSTPEQNERTVEPRSFAQGGVSSRYYFGQTELELSFPVNNTIKTNNLLIKDQSTLITNVDASGRFVNENYDNRLIFRDSLTENLLPGKADKNRVNTAYFEIKNRTAEFSVRMGRQTPLGAGVMGRFDGISLGYGSPQSIRINSVAGKLVDFSGYSQPSFYGLSIERDWLTLYFLNQMLDGVQDRRAIGAEIKYFKQGSSLFASVDYDVHFKMLNAATLNASTNFESSGTSLNLMADYRRSPFISTRNALNGAMVTSVTELLAAMNHLEVEKLARDRTGSMSLLQLSATQKLSSNWQLGGDFKVSRVSNMPESGAEPDPITGLLGIEGYVGETPDSGLEKTVTGQLIGSNLYSDADITSAGLSLINSHYVQQGQSLFIYNRTSLTPNFAIDSSWSFYRQSDYFGGELSRHSPTLRGTYQIKQSLSLDAEIGIELTTSSSTDQTTKSKRKFASAGFRWDF
jgi:hypothetical protein